MSYTFCVKLLGLRPQPGVLHAASAAMVVALAIVGACIACLVSGGEGGNGFDGVNDHQMAAVHSTWVTVGSGDTLWGIAREHGRHADVREDVRTIVLLNELDSDTLHPGQRLQLP